MMSMKMRMREADRMFVFGVLVGSFGTSHIRGSWLDFKYQGLDCVGVF